MKKIISALLAVILSAAFCAVPSCADVWKKTGNGYVYTYDDGTTAEQGWLQVGKKTYYIQKDGTRKTGWLTLKSGTKYYFDKKGVLTRDKILKFTSGTYYFMPNGKMAADYCLKKDRKLYYFQSDGKLLDTVSMRSGLDIDDFCYVIDDTFYGVGLDSSGYTFGAPSGNEMLYLYLSPNEISDISFFNTYFFEYGELSGFGYVFEDDEEDMGKVIEYFTGKYDSAPTHMNDETGECYWKFKSYYLSVFYFDDGIYCAMYSRENLADRT